MFNRVKMNRDNYNIDARSFRREKLKSPVWITWFIGGTLAAAVPVLISSEYFAVTIGMLICWWLILFSLSGVVYHPADQSQIRRFANANGLMYKAGNAADSHGIFALLSNVLNFEKARAPIVKDILRSLDQAQQPATLFNLSFEYSASGVANLYQYNVLYVDSNTPMFPSFVIDGKDVYDFEQFVDFSQKEAIRLEGTFGQNLTVYVDPSEGNAKRLTALGFMTPDVMQLFEKYFSTSSLVSKNGRIAILTRKNLYQDDSYQHTLEGVRELSKKISRQATIRQSVES